jgi:hypothetical protein
MYFHSDISRRFSHWHFADDVNVHVVDARQ